MNRFSRTALSFLLISTGLAALITFNEINTVETILRVETVYDIARETGANPSKLSIYENLAQNKLSFFSAWQRWPEFVAVLMFSSGILLAVPRCNEATKAESSTET